MYQMCVCGGESLFHAPNVTQTARKTNMTFAEKDMMRAPLVWIRTRLLRRIRDMFCKT